MGILGGLGVSTAIFLSCHQCFYFHVVLVLVVSLYIEFP